MIRKAGPADTEGIMKVLLSIGNEKKDPVQGFLMDDYTKDTEKHRQKYEADLERLKFTYVYLEDQEIKAFLIAYDKDEWLRAVPGWQEEIHWHPGFDKNCLQRFVLVSQTAMYPELTGRGIGSRLFETMCHEASQEGIRDVFAETIIAPVPNFASLNFRVKQNYQLVGMRYEEMAGTVFTTLVYHKDIR